MVSFIRSRTAPPPTLSPPAGSRDVAVVGGGPVGALAAIAWARRGARVVLLEANPRAAARFAGEWIHPPGVAVLDRLRVGRLDGEGARTGYGFAVLPEDGGEPVLLPYPDGETALACEHERIVRALREQARACEGVEYRPYARVTRVEANRLWVEDRRAGHVYELSAARIVAADGRKSALAAGIGGPRSALLSHMASLELSAVTLPHEGFGHVILGGPGPVLMYRIGEDRVRMCLDVPLRHGPAARTRAFLWERFAPCIPASIRDRFRVAVQDGPLSWAATRFQPRVTYGVGALALVGDAVGHLHPLTAAGLTQGFLDAEALAQSAEPDAYRKQRDTQSYVPELLGNALYQVFSREDASAVAIRRAVYRAWRQSPAERHRTMQILTGDEVAPHRFASTFTRMALGAVADSVGSGLREQGLRAIPAALGAYGEWIKWPLSGLLPPGARMRRRAASSGAPEIASLPAAPAANGGGNGKSAASGPSEPLQLRAADDGDPRGGADWAFCLKSLQAVSRTFSRPISMLPHDLERAVTCGYLLCRVADTIEDHPNLGTDARDALFAHMLGVLERGADPGELARHFCAIEGDDAELELARNLPCVMRVCHALSEPAQEACRRWISEMVRGMQLYTHRTRNGDGLLVLHTLADLERYCYFVAGTVGHLLTDLFVARLGRELSLQQERALRLHAEHFGAGLQLVNVLKDIAEDHQRGVCFIPESACGEQGIEARELTDAARRELAHRAVAPVFELARQQLAHALEYSLAIPPAHAGIRMFCLVPLWMAARTWVWARGNDALFTPGMPVKISRDEVERLITGCARDCDRDDQLRAGYAELWHLGSGREVRVERSAAAGAGARSANRGF